MILASIPMIATEVDNGDDDEDDDANDWVPRGLPQSRQPFSPPMILTSTTLRSVRATTPEPTIPDDPVTAIARLQSFDGSFGLDQPLCQLIFGDKRTLESLRSALPPFIKANPDAESIWATAIAVAYLRTKVSDLRDIWIGLWEKANKYAVRALAGSTLSFEQAISDAEKLL